MTSFLLYLGGGRPPDQEPNAQCQTKKSDPQKEGVIPENTSQAELVWRPAQRYIGGDSHHKIKKNKVLAIRGDWYLEGKRYSKSMITALNKEIRG